MEFRTLEEMNIEMSFCEKCELHEERNNVVFGEGNISADVMFVGEAPGKTEDEIGRPFVGAAGKLLDKFFQAIDVAREDVYITNLVKCRPPLNRDPDPKEQVVCMKYLLKEIEFVSPKILVCLGRISAKALINENFKITAEHGRFFLKNGIYLMGMYHPAALLRFPMKREQTMQDFLILKQKMQELGLQK